MNFLPMITSVWNSHMLRQSASLLNQSYLVNLNRAEIFMTIFFSFLGQTWLAIEIQFCVLKWPKMFCLCDHAR